MNVRNLTCCCCGNGTRGRQWWNRDTGYGLCGGCAEWLRKRPDYNPEEFARLYGSEGEHFNVHERVQ